MCADSTLGLLAPELPDCVPESGLGDDVVAVENGPGLVAREHHRDLLGDAGSALTAWYVHKHPEESPNFEDYWHVQVHRLARDAREVLGTEVVPDETIAELQQRADEVRDRFKVPICEKCETFRLNHTWTRLDVVSMARECPEIGGFMLPTRTPSPTCTPISEASCFGSGWRRRRSRSMTSPRQRSAIRSS
jgi:hypothetical protein